MSLGLAIFDHFLKTAHLKIDIRAFIVHKSLISSSFWIGLQYE